MPELPEVETTIKGLKAIKNKKIHKIQIHIKKLRFKIPNQLKTNIINTKISNIRRIAKYIIIDLDNKFSIVIHLGMSGRLKLYTKKFTRVKHDHFIIIFNNKVILVYNDPRRFGFIDLVKTNNLSKRQ